MEILEVPLSGIDFEDERFRISEDLVSAGLEKSLRCAGQLSPVHLWGDGRARFVIMCGFRRLHVMRRLGIPAAHAIIRRQPECGALPAFLLALWESLSHRELDPLERARVLAGLKGRFGVEQERLVGEFLPLLGLSPHKNVLADYLRLHEMRDPLRQRFRLGHVTLTSAVRLCGMGASFQACLDGILDRVRWSASMQREVLDLLEELAAISASSPEEVLSRSAAGVLADAGLSGHERGRRIRDRLRRSRNPTLHTVMDRFRSGARALGLPPSVRISPDPFFETSHVKVEFEVASADGFRSAVEALQSASRRPALEELFRPVVS